MTMLVVALSASWFIADGELDEVVARHAATVSAMHSIRLEAEYVSNALGPNTIRYQLYKQGSQIRCKHKQNAPGRTEHMDFSFDGKDYRDLRGANNDPDTIGDAGMAGMHAAGVRGFFGAGPTAQLPFHERTAATPLGSLLIYPMTARFGATPLAELRKLATKAELVGMLTERPVVKLSVPWPTRVHETLEVELDPKHGYMIVREKRRYTADNLATETQAEVKEFKEVAPGVHFPMVTKGTGGTVGADGKSKSTIENECRVLKIEVNQPIDPLQLQVRFPKGTRVVPTPNVTKGFERYAIWGTDGPERWVNHQTEHDELFGQSSSRPLPSPNSTWRDKWWAIALVALGVIGVVGVWADARFRRANR